ncbi:MAG: 4Fe-4S cluster-binding domain-containing protein [Parvimonas sp.]|uniref:radical SAM protein n=1 Tax=Parvimonas sp. TaxID=1944660 RepID=UPI0025F44E83|nr:radical SAM protein [Parvimonas sp.]MCI5997108.1 4Fe-4S cluster-binding domain-containing protein [Parvimonas sp.]
MKKELKIFDSSVDNGFKIIFNLNNSVSLKYNCNDFNSIEDILSDNEISDLLLNPVNPFQSGFYEKSMLNVTIILTLECNFRCPYCFETLKKENISNKLYNVIEFLTKFIIDNKIKHLNINWFGGEPLLEISNIEKIYNLIYPLCKLKGISYNSTITTNGYLLNKYTYNKLKSMKVSTFQITIDGVEKVHNEYRYLANGKGTFNKIISNLDDILKEDTSDTNFIIRTNCSDENIDYMPEYFKFFINNFGIYSNVMADFHQVTNFSNNCNSEVSDTKKMVDLINNFVSIGGNHVPILWRLYSKNSCLAFDKNCFVIYPNGKVSKCSVDSDSNRVNLGFVEDYYNVKNINDSIMFSDFDECKECEFASFCKNGDCLIYEEKNKKPRCIFFKNFLDSIIEILEKQDLIDYTLE